MIFTANKSWLEHFFQGIFIFFIFEGLINQSMFVISYEMRSLQWRELSTIYWCTDALYPSAPRSCRYYEQEQYNLLFDGDIGFHLSVTLSCVSFIIVSFAKQLASVLVRKHQEVVLAADLVWEVSAAALAKMIGSEQRAVKISWEELIPRIMWNI